MSGGLQLSVSSKLADLGSAWELLSRLSFDELRLLARRNGVALQREDAYGNVQKARSKEEAVDILVASEFKESDIIKLLGVNRLTKEELLYAMSARQLHQLAKETGVLLEKSTMFWTRRAAKKKDVVNALKVLSEQKVREYAGKIRLIKKAAKRTGKGKRVKSAAKPTRKAPARKRAKKTRELKPSVREPIPPSSKSALVVKEEPAPVLVLYGREQEKTANVIEVTIRERLMEREVVRRQLALGKRREESGAKKIDKIAAEAKKSRKSD